MIHSLWNIWLQFVLSQPSFIGWRHIEQSSSLSIFIDVNSTLGRTTINFSLFSIDKLQIQADTRKEIFINKSINTVLPIFVISLI